MKEDIIDFDIPDGWLLSKVADIASKIQYGVSTKPTEDESGVPILRMGSIQGGEVDLRSLKYTADEAGIVPYLLNPDDILFNRTNSPELVGKAAIYKHSRRATFASYLIRVLVDSRLAAPDFLCFWINSSWGRSWANREKTDGVSQSNINSMKRLAMPIPLPPVAEQRRIVAAVERILDKVTAARARLDRVPTTLKRFRQAVLAAACSGRLTADWRVDGVDDGWRTLRLATLLSEPLANGRSVQDAETGVPVLRLTAIRNGRVLLAERKIGRWNRDEAKRFFVKRLDFLVSRGNGSLALVGRGGLLSEEPDEVAYPDTLIRVRVKPGDCSQEYLALVWDSMQVRDQIESTARTTAGIHKISQGDIENISIPLPPLAEQREIVRRVSALFARADALEAAVAAARRRVDALTQAVLAKAFRGELVPTEAELARRENRPYEPAADLLARVRATPGAAAKPKRARRAKGSANPPPVA